MKRALIALGIILLLVAITYQMSFAAISDGIGGLSVGEIYGERIPLLFRQGVVAGMMSALANAGMACPYMTPGMLVSALDAARADKSITDDWKVYGALLYIMVQAKCEMVPQEKPNA